MTHEVAAVIPVGSGPAGVAVGPFAVYVTCRNSSRLYVISKTDDTVIDSIELAPTLAFPIAVALDTRNQIYAAGRLNADRYDMDKARLVKLNSGGVLLDSLELSNVQGNGEWPGWKQMSVIGMAINEPEIIIPWQRSWDVHTGVILTNTSLSGRENYPFNPREYGYRGPGAAYDNFDRGWTSGEREAQNFFICHWPHDYWQFQSMGEWYGAQIAGDVAVDFNGCVWTGNEDGLLIRFDPAIGVTTSFTLEYQEIRGIAIDSHGYIWVALHPMNAMVKFDTFGNPIGDTVQVGNLPVGFGDMTGLEFGRRMTGIDDGEVLPETPMLLSAYPNPFNAATRISYSTTRPGPVDISIYDLLGRKVATICDLDQETGEHEVVWHAGGLPSGVYLARLVSSGYSQALKITLIK